MKKLLFILLLSFPLTTHAWFDTYYGTNLQGPILGGQPAITVPQGGTGQSVFPKYPLVGDTALRLAASSTLWVVGINATSTTASSTFQGLTAVNLGLTGATATNTASQGFNVTNGCF